MSNDNRMKSIHIINGPNLNLLGVREPDIYGNTPFDIYLERLRDLFPTYNIIYFQSNHEGDIIDYLQSEVADAHGIIINAGALSHYSYAIADALKVVECPIVEVHISKIAAREPHRHITVLTEVCDAMLQGFGLDGYRLALAHITSRKPI